MSICLNNDLLWLSIPRCASASIEKAIIDSKIPMEFYLKPDHHYHVERKLLYNKFGGLETVCITRDWFERWLSGLKHIWMTIYNNNMLPIIDWHEMNNDFIYNTFDVNFVNKVYNNNPADFIDIFSKLLKNKEDYVNLKTVKHSTLKILCSQNFWKGNEKCTYEFDINEINKFEEFIQNRYNLDFKTQKLNNDPKIYNNIIVNDELKNWVWNTFEKQFQKRNELI